jgi:hypothetical protein
MIISAIRYFTYVPTIPTESTTEASNSDVRNETNSVK